MNLTRLQSRITKVRVDCELSNHAIIQSINVPGSRDYRRDVSSEIPVAQGSVVQTVQLVVTLAPQELDNPSGQQATYECRLRAFDSTSQAWTYFVGSDPAGMANSTLVLTPAPTPITGTFVW